MTYIVTSVLTVVADACLIKIFWNYVINMNKTLAELNSTMSTNSDKTKSTLTSPMRGLTSKRKLSTISVNQSEEGSTESEDSNSLSK